MNKILTLLSAAVLLGAASCKKSADKNNGTGSTKGSWQLGTKMYQAKSVNSSSSGGIYELIAISDSTTGGEAMLTIIFNGGKPASGSYPVDTGANGVYISCHTGSSVITDVYNSGAATGINATVTTSGNSIQVSVPSVQVLGAFSGNTTTISASGISL